MAGTFYNANPLLKSAGVSVDYTPDQLQEYIKCKDDQIYFIEKYIKIISLDRGLISFLLYDYQKKFIAAMHENRFVISLQPRQMGKTQTVAAYLVWYLLFNSDKTVGILANKAAQAREIMSRMQLMIEHLPVWLQQGVVEWNKGSISFENNSKAFTSATSGSAVRGRSLSLLYVDETAAIPNTLADEFFTSTYPTISSGKTSKIILTSTPMGMNHFWKFWTEAEQGINGFIPLRVNYWEHPDRDEAWAQEQRKLIGEVKFNQETLCQFIGSSYTLISGDVIQKMAVKKPIFERDGFTMYEPPDKLVACADGPKVKGTYVLVADTSEGVGGDYSAFTIVRVDCQPFKLVAKYRSNSVSPLVYPSIINRWAKEYNDAYVLLEINKSEQVAYILHAEYELENLIFVGRDKKQGQAVGYGGAGAQFGVKTDKKVKRIGCSNFKDLVEQNKLIIHDADVIEEISTFIETKGSYAADDGKHDDLVMTLVLFGWLSGQSYFQELIDTDLRKNLYEARIRAIEEDVLPIGFFNDGTTSEIEQGGWQVYSPA